MVTQSSSTSRTWAAGEGTDSECCSARHSGGSQHHSSKLGGGVEQQRVRFYRSRNGDK